MTDGASELPRDGTTDEAFLRGVQVSDSAGMIEFLTKFPGYHTSRTTHIHVALQANASNAVSYSQSTVSHVGQLFLNEAMLSQIYAVSPYAAHIESLNRTSNVNDSISSSASKNGYSPFISLSLLGDTVEDGLVGYVTTGVNTTAEVETSGSDVGPRSIR